MDLTNTIRGHGAQTVLSLLIEAIREEREKFIKAQRYYQEPKKEEPTQEVPEIATKEEFWNLSKAERRAWQKAKEAERRTLNAAAHIDGMALLTKENVEVWRAQGMSYAAIARDIIGCSEFEVSNILKVGTKKPDPVPWYRKPKK
jgi:endonuclease/exonuclease/phosphatase (EEP) superfamily protein YafD